MIQRRLNITAMIYFGCLGLTGCNTFTDAYPVDLYQNASNSTQTSTDQAATVSRTVAQMKISGSAHPKRGGRLAEYLDKHQAEVISLEKKEISVIRFHDYMTLVIPASLLFDGGPNALLTSRANALLETLTAFLRPIPKVAITVAVYTDTPIQYDEASGVILSKAQARAVADYLWNHNADATVIAAASANEALSPLTHQKEVPRHRVEIILRDASSLTS